MVGRRLCQCLTSRVSSDEKRMRWTSQALAAAGSDTTPIAKSSNITSSNCSDANPQKELPLAGSDITPIAKASKITSSSCSDANPPKELPSIVTCRNEETGAVLLDCEWMYGDAGTGPFGFNETAHLAPWRWSGELSLTEAIEQLESSLHEDSRPIWLKVPANCQLEPTHICANQKQAIQDLSSLANSRAPSASLHKLTGAAAKLDRLMKEV